MPKKHSQLVCQHLENISSNAFERYQKVITDYTRNRHGIYALYKKDKLYYVGLAKNLRNRIRAHLRDRHSNRWDRFSVYLVLSDKHMKELESLLLRIVMPKGNKQKGKFIKSENLEKKLKNDVKKQQIKEIEGLFGLRKTTHTTEKNVTDASRAILARYLKSGLNTRLRGMYKGKLYVACILKNGCIRYNKRVYNSPSMAGIAVRKRTTNGWLFWKYERSPGEWVLLDELRR
ncbi:MAG: GIY-YIG nuclease family protein [Deltaproteobacteria bacterium]|nr:GIY-YIG nuclease family protein [Deltaproteobacteria bacterium]